MTEFDKGWNAAIKAAQDAVVMAPVFPKKDSGPAADAERLRILETCRKQVEALQRSPLSHYRSGPLKGVDSYSQTN